MNPDNIPFNALIVGATNCGKTSFLVKILTHEFLEAFDYIFLVCPTYIHNKTYDGFAENDSGFFVIIPEQDQINDFLKLISFAFEGTNTLIILDDCAASKNSIHSETISFVFPFIFKSPFCEIFISQEL